MVDANFVVTNRIGIRTLLKSYRVYSKGKGNANGRSIGNFIINGNTQINLAKKITVINKGSFSLGLKPGKFHVSTCPCVLGMGYEAKLCINGNVSAGPGVAIVILKNACLELGNNVYINSNSTIICGRHIRIGEYTQISWNVEICDTDFHRIVEQDSTISEPIEIGANTLIGRRAMIMKGVRVGDGSVVAAGAIVTKDVPQNSLVAGVPARIIKSNVIWE